MSAGKQPEALRLADACEQAASVADMGRPPIFNDWRRASAAELRRLHSVNADLLDALNNILVGMEASGGWEGDDGLYDAGMAAYRKATGEQA